MSEDFDITKLTDEELRTLAGIEPPPSPARPASGAEPMTTPFTKKAPAEGRIWEGIKGQLASPGIAVARALKLEDAEDVARQHGERMAEVRRSPSGAFGSTLANVGLGVAVPAIRAASLPGLVGASAVGGALEGAQDYGEGKPALPGAVRGAAGTAAANVALSAGAKLANAGLKRAGATGRWSSPTDEYIYDFAKSKGVDLRPGDLTGHPLARGIENVHAGPLGNAGLEKQMVQLEQALFGEGNQILNGLGRAQKAIDEANGRLWAPVYELAEQGTTRIRPLGARNALVEISEKYPKILNRIDNAQLQDRLAAIMEAPTEKALPGLTFREVRELQQAIGPEVAKMEKQVLNGTITKDEASSIKRLYGALHGDITRWGTHGSNQKAYNAYKEANEVYKKDILPWEKNDIVHKWKRGDYDNHNEALLRDLTAPASRSQQNNLLWYLGHTDHDATGYVEMVRMANRAAKGLARGTEEPGVPLGLATLMAPKLAAARAGAHAASGRSWATPLAGASPDIGGKRMMGGLTAAGGLSWDNVGAPEGGR